MPRGFERTLDGIATVLGQSLEAERSAASKGWLQLRDPRAKILAMLTLLVGASFVHRPGTLAAAYALTLAVAASTRIPFGPLLRRQWLAAGLFTGLVALPAIFLTPGPAIVRPPVGPAITGPGAEAAVRLLLRAVLSVHLALLLTQTTPWNRILRGLRGLGVPGLFVMILSVSHRYLLLLLGLAQEMLRGREARRVGRLPAAEARRQVAASAGALLIRAHDMGDEVFKAMAARGWRGEPRGLVPARWTAPDTLLCVAAVGLTLALLGVDRHAVR